MRTASSAHATATEAAGARMSETLPFLIDRLKTPIGEMLIVAKATCARRVGQTMSQECGGFCADSTAKTDSRSSRLAIGMASRKRSRGTSTAS